MHKHEARTPTKHGRRPRRNDRLRTQAPLPITSLSQWSCFLALENPESDSLPGRRKQADGTIIAPDNLNYRRRLATLRFLPLVTQQPKLPNQGVDVFQTNGLAEANVRFLGKMLRVTDSYRDWGICLPPPPTPPPPPPPTASLPALLPSHELSPSANQSIGRAFNLFGRFQRRVH